MKDTKVYKGIPTTIILSVIIILSTLVLAIFGKLPILGDADNQWIPFVFTLMGVAIYIMTSARIHRENFELRYLPDYFFRGAQAVIYLYVIMSIIAQSSEQENAAYNFKNWKPNLVGLLVGMFIPHVEKAMEGLGQRFEEILAGILPRSLTAKTSREKQLDQLRLEQKFQDIKMQSEGLISQMRDPGLSSTLMERLQDVTKTIKDGDMDIVQEKVSQLSWDFEKIKQSMREEELTVQDVIKRDNDEKKNQ